MLFKNIYVIVKLLHRDVSFIVLFLLEPSAGWGFFESSKNGSKVSPRSTCGLSPKFWNGIGRIGRFFYFSKPINYLPPFH